MNKKAMCLKCVHCFVFHAKEGDRYVCTMRGKRLEEDEENCKMYSEAVKNY